MKILDKTYFSAAVAKIVELEDSLIINGHVYNKNPITPKPLKWLDVKAPNEIFMDRTLFINNPMIGDNISNKMYMVDSLNPDICYGLLKESIIKYNKKDNIPQIELIAELTFGIYEFFYQNEKSIWIKGYIHNDAVILVLDKLTFEILYQENFRNNRISIVANKKGSVYFFVSGINTYIYKIDINSFAVTDLSTENFTGCTVLSMPTEIEKNSVYIFQNMYGDNEVDALKLKKYTFDFDSDTVSNKTVNIDLGDTEYLYIPEDDCGCYDTFFIESIEGTKYINLAMYSTGESDFLNSSQALYTLQEISEDSFKLVDSKSFVSTNYRGFIRYKNSKALAFMNDTIIDFYEWNELSKKYKRCNCITGGFNVFAIDSNNKIWIQKWNTEVEIFANLSAINIEADFEKDTYDFQGVDIESEIFVSCQNYSGENVIVNLKLGLVGNVVFKENQKKTIVKRTTSEDFLKIPVTIKGEGKLEVYANLN